jgi:hypothetical protein
VQWKGRQSLGTAGANRVGVRFKPPRIHVSIHASLEAGDRVAIVGHDNIDHASARVKKRSRAIYIFFTTRRAMTVTDRAASPGVQAERSV